MKIGILTFHCAYNFGAMLQAYALQEQLRLMGHDAHILDYRPDYLVSPRPPLYLRNLVMHPRWWFHDRVLTLSYFKHHYLFKFFEKKYYRFRKLNGKSGHFDAIIIGSDQVWNRRFNGNDDPIWFGKLPEGISADKIITYAASAGDATDKEFDTGSVHQRLRNIESVLVREQHLNDILNQHGIRSRTVIDPTLLASPRVWSRWTKKTMRSDFVLVYQGREHPDVMRIAMDIARQKGCRVITIDWYKASYELSSPHGHKEISPAGFVKLVARARCVITSSFHGTAFAIICNTPFYSIRMGDGADSRVAHLLADLDLSDRFISRETTPEFSPVDYATANSKLDTLRKDSLTLLNNALKI